MIGITCPSCKMRIEIGVDTPEIEEPINSLKVVSLVDWKLHQNVGENPEYKGYVLLADDPATRRVILKKVY